MTPDLFLGFLGLAVLALVISAQNWRHAFLLVVILGFAQDPIRKITPGEPVVLVMLSSAMLGVALMVAMTKVGSISLRPLTQGDRMARLVLGAYVGLVIAQAFMALVRFKSPVIAGIGLIAYLAPIPAVWIAWRYVRGTADVRRFMLLYVICAMVLAGSLFAQKMGVKSPLFEEVGVGLVIYDREVGLLPTFIGFARSPEVAAWHLGAAACFLVIVAVALESGRWKWLAPVLVIALLALATLTGRRKVLVVVAAFAGLYVIFLLYYRQQSAVRKIAAAVGAAALVGAATLFMSPDQGTLTPYVTRGSSVFSDAFARFEQLGIESMSWAINQTGYFGIGAGAASQGTQHFGGASWAVKGAAEGGLGKIIVELGLPGLLLVAMSSVFIFRSIRKCISELARHDRAMLKVALGCLAFVGGNIPVFAGASQIYGDPFVLFILGTCMGFVFAGTRLLDVRRRAAARAQRGQVPGAFARPPHLNGLTAG
jgi:hypothetical protein